MKVPRFNNEEDYRRWCRGQMLEASLCLLAVIVIAVGFIWSLASGRLP